MSSKEALACQYEELHRYAQNVRKHIIRMLCEAKSGHPGGSLSASDIVSALYFSGIMKHDPKDPKNPQRDRFILSKGHAAPVLYAALAEAGYFPLEWLSSLRKLGSHLQGHPDMNKCPGVEVSTGSLGQGLSVACGLALGLKRGQQDETPQVFVLTGDGELQEGQNWEALMYAAHMKLNNLVVLVDYNGLQIDGEVEKVNSLTSLSDKFKSFGWHCRELDGHNFTEIIDALSMARSYQDGPVALVCKTVKGKGVSFMEHQCGWHGKAPSAQEADQAIRELSYGEYTGDLEA